MGAELNAEREAGRAAPYINNGLVVGAGADVRKLTDEFIKTIAQHRYWSREQENSEVAGILNALQKDGQDGLMKALGKEKMGTLQIGSRLGEDVQAVWVTRTEEGRKISALSERWQGFGELRRGARSLDYPFTYIEIFIEEDGGKGDGSLIPAARVRSKGENNIEIENFGIYPARLTNIKVGRK